MDLQRHVLACAEGAADAGEDEPHLLQWEPERGRDLAEVFVQPLRRDVQRHAAVVVRDGETRLRPERGLILHADLVLAADYDVGCGVWIAMHDQGVVDDVAVLMKARRAGPEGRDRFAHGSQDLVSDLNRLRGGAREVDVVGRDERHCFTDVAHAVFGEHGLVPLHEPEALARRQVRGDEDRANAGHQACRGHIDGQDPRVRMGGAQRVPEEHPLLVQVARVLELAEHLRHAVGARGRLADAATHALPGERHRRYISREASWTASRIFPYPVQRQRFPARASRVSRSLGSGFARSRA